MGGRGECDTCGRDTAESLLCHAEMIVTTEVQEKDQPDSVGLFILGSDELTITTHAYNIKQPVLLS